MTVLIAGAGIGGLTLALTCQQAGIPFRIFEQSARIEPLGVGINVQPHAVRELIELGLGEQLVGCGLRTSEVAYFSKKGRKIWREPRGLDAGYHWPQFSVHRGKLQVMLHDMLSKRAGSDLIETGCVLESFVQSNTQVTAHFNKRDSEEPLEVSGEILVGCDGIHSAARHQMYPDEGPPVWGGAVLWRGTTIAKPFLDGATMAMAGHEYQKFVAYPISKIDPATGQALVNWIAELKFKPDHAWNREDWNRPGRLDEFLPAFEDWVFDWLDIPQLISDHIAVYEFPMVDRDPLDRWTLERVTLLGDAAHPMYPIGSNGATQSIIDARILVRELLQAGIGNDALEQYELERRPVTSKIVLANRQNGPDQIMQEVEKICGGDFDRIEDVLSREYLEKSADQYKHLTGFDVETLNNRPSIITGFAQ